MEVKYKFDSSMYNTVAVNIKKYRMKNEISIKDLAFKTGIKEKYLIDLEDISKNIKISIYDLYKISVILNVSIDKFFEK